MPRKDYDQFIALGSEFNHPYFLQTPYSDKGYAYSYAKLRNSRTTCIVPMFQYQGFNQGIFLDIFPYDNWIQEEGEILFNRIHQLAYDNSTFMRRTNPRLDEENANRVKQWPGRNYIEVYEEIQRLASKYKDVNTDKIAKIVFAFKLSQEVHDIEDYEETIQVAFNNLVVRIPKGYKRILEVYYGKDYMVFPPVEQRNGGHNTAIFNPDISYTDFLSGEV